MIYTQRFPWFSSRKEYDAIISADGSVEIWEKGDDGRIVAVFGRDPSAPDRIAAYIRPADEGEGED